MIEEKLLDQLFTKVQDYLNIDKDSPVVNYIGGSSLTKDNYSDIDTNGHNSSAKLFEDVDYYLKYALNTNHPQFNNQLNGGFVPPALVGEIISFITNTSMATYEIAPIGTILEKKIITKLNDLIGFKDGEGIMTTGGSNANMLAIQCARNKVDSTIKFKGNGSNRFHIYVSDQAHYSFQKAVNIMGIGLESIIQIRSVDGVMDSKHLRESIEDSIKNNFTPLMIASTSGTTVLGCFDSIIKNDLVAKEYNLWHHVDAAWGGPALFSDRLESLMKGVEQVDSVTWDAHKLMGTGLITSFILLKEKGQLISANSGGGEKYLFHEYENSEFDTGAMSLQCGRKVDSLKMWLAWRYYGSDGYAKLVDKQLDTAIYLEGLINEHPRLKMLYKRDYLNVCFQVIPKNNENIDEYNYKLRFHMVKQTKSLVNFARSKSGDIFFRYVLTNFSTNKEDIDIFIKNLFEAEDTFKLE